MSEREASRAPSSDEIIDLATRLAAYFARRVDKIDVEDLVSETLVRILDVGPDRWDPERGSLAQFAFGVVARGVLRDHRRERSRRASLSPEIEPAVEPAFDRRLDRQRALRRLRAQAGGDPTVLFMLDRETGAGPLWRALGLSPRQVRNARRRMARMARRRRSDFP